MKIATIALVMIGCSGPPPPCPEQADAIEPPRAGGTELDVHAGSCDLEWLGIDHALPDDEAAEVIALMRGWIGDAPMATPLVDQRGGIVFAKSADDEGADPPYPSSSSAAGMLACGLTSRWLRAHERSLFRTAAEPGMTGVTCDGSACCFPGMEFVSDRAIIFRRSEDRWVLAIAIEVSEAALAEDIVRENRGYVAGEVRRRSAQRCDEPPGLF